MTDVNVMNFIEHHGIKGMKWGVRRARSSGGIGTERTRFAKSPKRLSSSELEARIKRMENEKKYNSLNKRDVGPGQAAAARVLSNSGQKLAQRLLTGAGVLLVKQLLEKHSKLSSEHVGLITGTGGGKKN